MNVARFTDLLSQLSDDDWQALASGAFLLMVNDDAMQVIDREAHNVILYPGDFSVSDAAGLKQQVMQQAGELLNKYYLTHPLTPEGFKRQVRQLSETVDVSKLVAQPGQTPEHTLFVDVGEVVVESADSPRHRYGMFLELANITHESALKGAFDRWLESGEAYQSYLNKCVPL